MIKSFKNISKQEVKDALRLATQSALAGSICYYLMILLNIPERFVGVLSSVLVIETSIGNTFQQAKGRFLSTLVGVIIGFIFVALIPWELGVILSLLLSLFIINGISSFKAEWRYGVVAAVALALGSEGDTFDLALDRLYAIGFGVIIGILISLIIWPKTAESRTLYFIKKALKNTKDRFKIEFENTRESKNKKTKTETNNFSTNISEARKNLNSITFNKKKNLEKAITYTERLYNSITIIQRIAEKNDTNVNNGNSGIEKDSEKITQKVIEIIDKLSKNKKVVKNDIDKISSLIEDIKKHINVDIKENETNILISTFIFGLTEIKDSLENLHENLMQF